MNIFKSFETFLREPLSILKRNIIQIVSIQTGNIAAGKPSVDAALMKNKTQITVVNNEKMYNLLYLVNMRVEKAKALAKDIQKTG